LNPLEILLREAVVSWVQVHIFQPSETPKERPCYCTTVEAHVLFLYLDFGHCCSLWREK